MRNTDTMRGSRGGTGGLDPLPEKSQNISFHSNTGQDPLKNHKPAKPAFNVSPSTARQRYAMKWRFAGGPMIDRL